MVPATGSQARSGVSTTTRVLRYPRHESKVRRMAVGLKRGKSHE